MGKIGVYGGSFNPIHLGHIQAAEEMVQALNLDQVLIVPASVPPHKQMPAYSPSAEERLELVRQSLLDHPRLTACDLELRRPGPSYTVDTLTQLHAMRPEDEIYLLMGTDIAGTAQMKSAALPGSSVPHGRRNGPTKRWRSRQSA